MYARARPHATSTHKVEAARTRTCYEERMLQQASPDPSADAAPSPGTRRSSEARCAGNLGPKQRRQRFVIGWVGLAVCTLAVTLLALDGAPRLWRLPLIVPWWIAALGVLQARSNVCVALAARGLQQLDRAPEPQPHAELTLVRQEARRIHVRALLMALSLTVVSLLIPE
jgi:hypothetical protein